MNGVPWDTYGPILIVAAATMSVGVGGGLLTEIGPWYRALKKPSWQPPDWAFGPAWTIIFVAAATSAVLTWWSLKSGVGSQILIALYVLNGALNLAWSALFFRARRPDWALAELIGLWLSIAALIAVTLPANTLGAWLLAPYLAWVTFAGVLNWTVVRLNAPFNGVRP